MPRRVRSPRFRLLLVVPALGLLACGEDKSLDPCWDCAPWEGETPQNDSPEHLMSRFEATYERQVSDQHELLLTEDFRFRFSKEADPEIFAAHPSGWSKHDEMESTNHLFDGFTNGEGEFFAGASNIDLAFDALSIVDDPAHGDSAAFYRLAVVADVNLLLEFPDRDGWSVRGPHFFHLVRGDVAVLATTQQADSTRWYVRRWDDESTAPGALEAPEGASDVFPPPRATTWGAVKATYLR